MTSGEQGRSIDVQLVKTEHCSHCGQVKDLLEKLAPEFPDMKVQEISMIEEEGMKLVQKYGIMSSPGVIINGKLAFVGGASESQLRNKLNEYKS
ncbi:thioredoxin family protein [Patescibacteria group bacterium]|nr:thioredoxin family protein [Patescibacteria group bacterium]